MPLSYPQLGLYRDRTLTGKPGCPWARLTWTDAPTLMPLTGTAVRAGKPPGNAVSPRPW